MWCNSQLIKNTTSSCETIMCTPVQINDNSKMWYPVVTGNCSLPHTNRYTFVANLTFNYEDSKEYNVNNWCATRYQPKDRF